MQPPQPPVADPQPAGPPAPTKTAARRPRSILFAAIAVMLVAAGVGGYFILRPHRPALDHPPTSVAELQVVLVDVPGRTSTVSAKEGGEPVHPNSIRSVVRKWARSGSGGEGTVQLIQFGTEAEARAALAHIHQVFVGAGDEAAVVGLSGGFTVTGPIRTVGGQRTQAIAAAGVKGTILVTCETDGETISFVNDLLADQAANLP